MQAAFRGSTGKCIPVRCDHSKDSDVEAAFKRIEREQNGRLDLLVNNAYSAVTVSREILNVDRYKR